MSAEDIDRYFDALEEPKRATLQEMRRRILAVLPHAEQTLSYGMPAFKVDGKAIVGLAAFKNHLSYLPHSGSVLAALADETRDYEQTRGSLHFSVDSPLPQALIERLIATRLREVGAKTAPKRSRPG